MGLTKDALNKIEKIHALSSNVNSENHRKKLLYLARKHIDEIEYLYNTNDSHADIEAGDLAILCFEMIVESGKNPASILEQCFDRYIKKLKQLKEKK